MTIWQAILVGAAIWAGIFVCAFVAGYVHRALEVRRDQG